MHTPEQAKELWCPMVRIARHEVITIERPAIGDIVSVHEEHHVVAGVNHDALGSSGNRRTSPDHKPVASCRCIADKCAMWRWADQPFAQDGIDRSHMQRRGFCGIAGRPEVTA